MRSTKTLDLAAQVLRLDLEAAEHLRHRLLPLAEDPQQDVLRLDDPAAQLGRLVAGEEQGAARFLVVLLEHAWRLLRHSFKRQGKGGPFRADLRRPAPPKPSTDGSTGAGRFRVLSGAAPPARG